MKTFNRGRLKRLCQQGKLVAVESYHFDDQQGQSQSNTERPVRLRANNDDYQEGFVNLWEHDFRTKSGCCYQNENGTITLIVHSNCNYTFRIKE